MMAKKFVFKFPIRQVETSRERRKGKDIGANRYTLIVDKGRNRFPILNFSGGGSLCGNVESFTLIWLGMIIRWVKYADNFRNISSRNSEYTDENAR